MGKMAFARDLRSTVCRLHNHHEAGGSQGDPVAEEASSDPEGETVETRCPVCWRLLAGSVDECPGCGADTSRVAFGLHPRREREHAIIDDCEERMIDSGVLEAGEYFDFLDRLGPLSYLKGPLTHLQRMMPAAVSDRDTFNMLLAGGVVLVMLAVVLLAWPEIAKTVGGFGNILGEMLSGKPLVPG